MKFVTLIAVAALSATAFATSASAYESDHAHMLRHHHILRHHTMMNHHVYHGVGFGGHHRTTATGGNPGGYSDRN